MSLGGIAIAIGVLVDAGDRGDRERLPLHRAARREPRRGGVAEIVLEPPAVGRPIFFSMAIIVLSFVPVFALRARRGSCSTRSPSPRPSP